jgi:hypothetical protein
MIDGVNLEKWLAEKSVSVEALGGEIIYTHATGGKSILVKREVWRDDLITVFNPMLRDFYGAYLGASFGGMLLIATTVESGLPLSQGYRLPDLSELKCTAMALGIQPRPNEDLFMMGYAGMFFYGYESTGEASRLRCYDRDFKSADDDESFLEILNNWWAIHVENSGTSSG